MKVENPELTLEEQAQAAHRYFGNLMRDDIRLIKQAARTIKAARETCDSPEFQAELALWDQLYGRWLWP